MKKTIKSVWVGFKEKPMKFGIGVLLISLSLFIFFGPVKFKASHGDTKIELTTHDKVK